MQANNFNIHFLNQFHQEDIVYPGKKERQYKNVLFRQFGERKNEIPFIVPAVERKLDDSAIICRLISNLENETLPDYFRMSSFAHNLKRQVSSYMTMEPFSTTYYKTVLGLLQSFICLINEFQEKAQQKLLVRLKTFQTVTGNKTNNTTALSEEIDDFVIVMSRFLDGMYDYYNDFNCCVNKESEGLKGVIVTTYMEQYLVKLVALIEKIMYDTRSTQNLLASWKLRLSRRELQRIYN